MLKKLIIAVVVILVLAIAGFVAMGVFMVNNVPDGVGLRFEYPNDVKVGDTFDVTVTITNDLNESRKLHDLDLYDPILNGVSIVSVTPAPAADEGLSTLGSRTISFNNTIDAQSDFEIVISMTAIESGYYTGDVDVSIDGMLSIYTTTQTIEISDPEN